MSPQHANSLDEAMREAWERATPEQRTEWIRRGWLDGITDKVADGLERDPERNRYDGGPSPRRTLDFGEVEIGGTFRLIVTVELRPVEDPPGPETP